MKISTTRGELDESELQKRDGLIDNDTERTAWVEYWMDGDPACSHAQDDVHNHHCLCGAEKVHRSVNMFLKKAMVWGLGEAAKLP